jgi:hypothetical protein
MLTVLVSWPLMLRLRAGSPISSLFDAMVTTTFKTVVWGETEKVSLFTNMRVVGQTFPRRKDTRVTSSWKAHYLLRKQSLLPGIFVLSLEYLALTILKMPGRRLIVFVMIVFLLIVYLDMNSFHRRLNTRM